MPWDGYYDDHAPHRPLDRPIALTGFLGARTDLVARRIASLTGHPLFDLDRAIEHSAGCTTDELVLRDGIDALRALEAQLLPPALARRPAPVIALGEGTLLDANLRGRVTREAHLVYLRLSLPALVEAIRRQLARNPGRHYAWLMGLQPSERLLEPLFEQRRPGYEAAELIVDADMDAGAVAQRVLERLGLAEPREGGA